MQPPASAQPQPLYLSPTYGPPCSAGLQECVLINSTQDLADWCLADPECVAFVTKPGNA